jgi:hypothetical protein
MSSVEEFGERRLRMLLVDGLIQRKTALARPRDPALIPELAMMREGRARSQAYDRGDTGGRRCEGAPCAYWRYVEAAS